MHEWKKWRKQVRKWDPSVVSVRRILEIYCSTFLHVEDPAVVDPLVASSCLALYGHKKRRISRTGATWCGEGLALSDFGLRIPLQGGGRPCR